MVQVRIADGVLEGEVVENPYGGTFVSYKGIPYAQPPVDDLRFKAPQPVKPWKGVRKATKVGPKCYQADFIDREDISGSEDCLYLNVYTPDVKPKNPLPVMVYIHGGGFLAGDGGDQTYGPEFLIRHGIVYVTINYRLHVLGFLCLDTEDVPGNAGMKDQVAALRWVNKNIHNFGGDPDNVTIFGESAGGASVSYHLMSPMSKGLFKRAIAQSGSSNCRWASTTNARERAIAAARTLGFYSEDPKELYEFYKKVPYTKFIGLDAPLTFAEAESTKLQLYWTPVSEKSFKNIEAFFSGDILNEIRTNVHEGVDVIQGYTEHEGLLTLGMVQNYEKFLSQINNFAEFFLPRHVQQNCNTEKKLTIGKKIKQYYFKHGQITSEHTEKLNQYASTESFVYDIIQWHKICASQNRNKLYMYKFEVADERNYFSGLIQAQRFMNGKPSVCHADDLGYLFPMKGAYPDKLDQNSSTFKSVDRITTLWTNFAKYGDPTPDDSLGARWEPYTLEQQNYLHITNDGLIPDVDPEKDEVDFLEKITKL